MNRISINKVEYLEDEPSFGKFLKKNCSDGDIFLTLGAGKLPTG